MATNTFDGRGQFTAVGTVVFEDERLGISHIDFPGECTVNPNCTGSLVDLGRLRGTADFVIVDGGKEIMQITTNISSVVTRNYRRY